MWRRTRSSFTFVVAVAFYSKLKPNLLGRKQGLASLLNQGWVVRQTLNCETWRTGDQGEGMEDACLSYPDSCSQILTEHVAVWQRRSRCLRNFAVAFDLDVQPKFSPSRNYRLLQKAGTTWSVEPVFLLAIAEFQIRFLREVLLASFRKVWVVLLIY